MEPPDSEACCLVRARRLDDYSPELPSWRSRRVLAAAGFRPFAFDDLSGNIPPVRSMPPSRDTTPVNLDNVRSACCFVEANADVPRQRRVLARFGVRGAQ